MDSFWAEILSKEPGRIRRASRSLNANERQALVAHLERMASEPGWHEGQRLRAQAALAILAEKPLPGNTSTHEQH